MLNETEKREAAAEIKRQEDILLDIAEKLRAFPRGEVGDQQIRWASMGITDIEKGCMCLRRAVYEGQRA